ncbi:DNA-binding protein [Haloferax mediterranei ATCC 33500]|uniref:DNA binding domain-containing protein n=1 Tax=Haloferax mediterranei (strain ATCC 33500 / DSM 1411 / JCM 8866 / NBRC 14739 / NCIMB 2177 / R-4) TaxID=523841 RepID=I3R4E2_HALMT|nr:helix-turn-helix domain-containing protein [Haloferax mediterranei]AFK19102.1 DNA binding domain-containing protein [Haloferax mediterranei ATCC 33500]AHZ21537.1 DNA-binding protein [Haloferax mediterranei ATCC 33500]EMA03998.1 DNA binding domain-containing protein [Haloferax mediterranei ATCC 33500]MDX5989197.1 helix-turn-helix domain-containing protein [Haloferax mediterranei ATCC 33500]QCQ75575.1 DNA-binding protein [Haloferax mediterranei ATCC 33500]
MASVIAELRVSGPGAILTEKALQALPEAEIRIQYQGTSEQAGIVVRGCDFDEFEAEVQSDPSIDTCERVADFSDVRVYNITAGATQTLISELLATKGIQILEATSPAGDSNWRLRVRSPSRDSLSEFIAECRETDVSVQLATLYSETSPPDEVDFQCPAMETLTDDQYDALESACEMGYFQVPRGVSLSQLSQEFGIGSQAMSERLRRGVNTLIEAHLRRDAAEANE